MLRPSTLIVKLLVAASSLALLGEASRAQEAPAVQSNGVEQSSGVEKPPAANEGDDKKAPEAESVDVASEQASVAPAQRAEARARLQESLALLGFDGAYFEAFKNQEPVSGEERDRLAKLLYGLSRIPRVMLLEASREQPGHDPQSVAASVAPGQAYFLRVLVNKVTREEVPAELRETLGFDGYYRCEAETSGERIVIVARHVPGAWKLDSPLRQQASAVGIYVKQLPLDAVPARDEHDQRDRVLLFAADRVAWHPSTLLAHLGVDYGLFETVKDRAPLRERDLFYQMLAVASHMAPEYIEYQIRGLLKRQIEQQEPLAQNRDLPASQREAAERALERARAGASDVVPLFNNPQSQRGEFVVLRGEALRAIEIRVEDPEIRRQFFIDRYYEVDVVTPDSQNNPIVCCLAELPPDMPMGESIHESVRVAGFFLKAYAFETRRTGSKSAGGKSVQIAPLIVGRTLSVVPTPKYSAPTQSLTLAAGVLVVLAVCGAFMWHMRRVDRRAEAQLKLRRELLPSEISLAEQAESGVDNP